MLGLLALVISSTSYVASQGESKCMECASPNLQGRWGLTGFAQMFRPESFSATCLPGTDTDHYSMCSGYCMTYLFEDPDTIGIAGTNVELMVVRGCQRRLLGLQGPEVASATNPTSFCQYDREFERVNTLGKTVYSKALVVFCTGDSCNSRVQDFSVEATNCPSTPSSPSDVVCYNCDSTNSDCYSATEPCNKKFCFKSAINLRGLKSVHKSCSNINLFGNENGCVQSAVTTIPANLATLNGDMTQCFCTGSNYCNGASAVHLSFILSIVALTAFKVVL